MRNSVELLAVFGDALRQNTWWLGLLWLCEASQKPRTAIDLEFVYYKRRDLLSRRPEVGAYLTVDRRAIAVWEGKIGGPKAETPNFGKRVVGDVYYFRTIWLGKKEFQRGGWPGLRFAVAKNGNFNCRQTHDKSVLQARRVLRLA